jgi:opacity protein-like surface antigen
MPGIARLVALGFLSAAFLANTGAQAADGFYLAPGIGVLIPTDKDFETFGVAGTVEYKAGLSLDVAAGYRIDNFRLEAELGYGRFGINRITTPAGSSALHGDIEMLSGFASAYLDLPFGGMKPYIGAGVGIVRTDGSDVEVDPGEGLVFDKSTDLGLHGEVGFTVDLASQVTIGPSYRYLYIRNGGNGFDHTSVHQMRVKLQYTF